MEMQYRTIARNLCVSVGTVYNACKHFSRGIEDRINTRLLSQYDEILVIEGFHHII